MPARQSRIRSPEEIDRLLEVERLASIGQLAAGVAHEINTPVGYLQSNLKSLSEYIAGLVELVDGCARLIETQGSAEQRAALRDLRERLDAEFIIEDIQSLLEESRSGVAIIRDITLTLRDFARAPEGRTEAVELNGLIKRALRIAENDTKYVAEIETDLSAARPVIGDTSMLSQVVLNLVMNACHALDSGGEIRVRTADAGEDRVAIEVEDTGCGIPEDRLEAIFEPFYTTKPEGKGTGLGLSMIREIVDRHHGTISVTSSVGLGTCFRVELPAFGDD